MFSSIIKHIKITKMNLWDVPFARDAALEMQLGCCKTLSNAANVTTKPKNVYNDSLDIVKKMYNFPRRKKQRKTLAEQCLCKELLKTETPTTQLVLNQRSLKQLIKRRLSKPATQLNNICTCPCSTKPRVYTCRPTIDAYPLEPFYDELKYCFENAQQNEMNEKYIYDKCCRKLKQPPLRTESKLFIEKNKKYTPRRQQQQQQQQQNRQYLERVTQRQHQGHDDVQGASLYFEHKTKAKLGKEKSKMQEQLNQKDLTEYQIKLDADLSTEALLPTHIANKQPAKVYEYIPRKRAEIIPKMIAKKPKKPIKMHAKIDEKVSIQKVASNLQTKQQSKPYIYIPRKKIEIEKPKKIKSVKMHDTATTEEAAEELENVEQEESDSSEDVTMQATKRKKPMPIKYRKTKSTEDLPQTKQLTKNSKKLIKNRAHKTHKTSSAEIFALDKKIKRKRHHLMKLTPPPNDYKIKPLVSFNNVPDLSKKNEMPNKIMVGELGIFSGTNMPSATEKMEQLNFSDISMPTVLKQTSSEKTKISAESDNSTDKSLHSIKTKRGKRGKRKKTKRKTIKSNLRFVGEEQDETDLITEMKSPRRMTRYSERSFKPWQSTDKFSGKAITSETKMKKEIPLSSKSNSNLSIKIKPKKVKPQLFGPTIRTVFSALHPPENSREQLQIKSPEHVPDSSEINTLYSPSFSDIINYIPQNVQLQDPEKEKRISNSNISEYLLREEALERERKRFYKRQYEIFKNEKTMTKSKLDELLQFAGSLSKQRLSVKPPTTTPTTTTTSTAKTTTKKRRKTISNFPFRNKIKTTVEKLYWPVRPENLRSHDSLRRGSLTIDKLEQYNLLEPLKPMYIRRYSDLPDPKVLYQRISANNRKSERKTKKLTRLSFRKGKKYKQPNCVCTICNFMNRRHLEPDTPLIKQMKAQNKRMELKMYYLKMRKAEMEHSETCICLKCGRVRQQQGTKADAKNSANDLTTAAYNLERCACGNIFGEDHFLDVAAGGDNVASSKT